MKNQDLFSSKDKSKKLNCCLLQYLFGALRVNGRNCSFRCIFSLQADTILEALYCPAKQTGSDPPNLS